jgi:hypothetical protein
MKPCPHPVGNVNRFLGNSCRTDLFGGEMACDGGADGEPTGAAAFTQEGRFPENVTPDLWPGSEIRGSVPALDWGKPGFGLMGTWAFANPTALRDVLRVKVAERNEGGARTLDFLPTRHRWTPAGTLTFYRSLPAGSGSYPYAGTLAIKEQKCITEDGVFATEWTLTHDQGKSARFDILLETPFSAAPGSDLLVVDTATHARCLGKEVPLQGHAAIGFHGKSGLAREVALGPFESVTLRFGLAVDLTGAKNPPEALQAALGDAEVFARRERSINRWFDDNVPPLSTADGDLMKVYYYRWFLLYRARHHPAPAVPHHPYPRPCFYESPFGDWFGGVVGLSVGLQLQEAKWARKETAFAEGHIAHWTADIANYQRYVQFAPAAMAEYLAQRPIPADKARLFEEVKAYCQKRQNPDDPDDFPIQVGSWPTGAEYQPNFYQFTRPPWDWRQDHEGVKGTDRRPAALIRLDTVMALVLNLRGASRLGRGLGRREEAMGLDRRADRLLARMKAELWDERLGLFLGADPQTRARADEAPCFDSFMPFLCEETHEPRYLKAFDAFFDPRQFWDEFPIATVSKKCPMYASGNAITGPTEATLENPHPYACCWNGPVWHFSNTFAAWSLGAVACGENGRHLRAGWLEFMARWTDLHFLYGDRSVPMANEHSRPVDGARFRRFHDYFHSSWIDPFLKYWAGIRWEGESRVLTFDPFTPEPFRLGQVPIAGREWTFSQSRVEGALLKQIWDDRGELMGESVMGKLQLRIP